MTACELNTEVHEDIACANVGVGMGGLKLWLVAQDPAHIQAIVPKAVPPRCLCVDRKLSPSRIGKKI